MDPYSFIIENKELIKPIYGLIITLISIFIVLKADKLFMISLHQGIRYFRNAFFFFGLAFVARYLLGAEIIYNYVPDVSYYIIKIFFEFFIIMAGFFLIYSLIWKKFEQTKVNYISSLLNPITIIFYGIALVIVLLDHAWQTYAFMFLSQIIIFIIASAISLNNYLENGRKHKFLKYFFLAMILILIAWILNAVAALLLEWNQFLILNISGLNIIVFLLFLLGVISVTKK